MIKDGRNLLDHICGQEKKDWFIEFCFADIVILSGDIMINKKQNSWLLNSKSVHCRQ